MRYLLAFSGLFVATTSAFAGTVTMTLPIIVVPPPLAIVFSQPTPSIPCNAASGTVVTALSTTGGNGNAVTWTISPATDFAVQGTNVVVSSGGIASANCNKTISVSVTAAQP